MPWVKLDDHFDEHPKLAQAGPLGLALWVAGLAYCNRNLTDGFIPHRVAHAMLSWEGIGIYSGTTGEDVTGEMVAGMLVTAGLWEREGSDYRVHDYLEFQPSRTQVTEARAKARLRMSFTRSSREVHANNRRSSDAPVPVPVPLKDKESSTARVLETEPDNGANAPPAPPTKARKAPTVTPPAVLKFRDATSRFPAKSWYGRVAEAVGEDEEALERWFQVCSAWVGKGWKPTNVDGMLECFGRGEIPGQGLPRTRSPVGPQLTQLADGSLLMPTGGHDARRR
jgi:hypothetical protein